MSNKTQNQPSLFETAATDASGLSSSSSQNTLDTHAKQSSSVVPGNVAWAAAIFQAGLAGS